MASHPHRDGVNPLRPYYIPPSIGEPSDLPPKTGPNPFPHGAGSTGRYASKARDIFSDIDYSNYIAEPSSSVVRTVKDLVDELLWKYTSVLMAQPFEVAKTILQVRSQDDPGALARLPAAETLAKQPSRNHSRYGSQQHAESDSEPDEPDYFTSNAPSTPTPSRSRARRRSSSPPSTPQAAAPSSAPPHQLDLRQPDSILEVVGQVWSKEGAWGVWKGSNASFIYTVLQSLMENWSRSLLSALFNVPDLGLREDVDRLVDIASPYPWASLCVAAAAAVATGLLLAPLDVVRTRLLVTPTGRQPRHTLPILRSLPSYFCPPSIFLPTMLHSLVHPVLSLSTPLVLRTRFMINQDVNPTTFSAAKFCSSTAALLFKLPLETVLRRGQVAVLNTPAYLHASGTSEGPKGKAKLAAAPAALEFIVPAGKYDGVFGTMHTIVNEEGSRAAATGKAAAGPKKGKAKIAETVYRRGQGLEGLWRGWKVSWWGLVGLWAAGVVGGGGDGEF